MPTRSLLRFTLEDFFDEYEHQRDLINLASSDGLPWTIASLEENGISIPLDARSSLQYPDTRATLVPPLRRFCAPPDGVDVLPTSGAAEAMAIVMHELSADDADEQRPVGIPEPAFGAFRGLASMLGVATETYDYAPSRGWHPDVDRISELATRCRALIVINPHNPTGCVIPDDAMAAIAQEAAAHKTILIVNEVFRTPDETSPAIRLGSDVVVLGSFSKIYGLPGLRLGWLMADRERVKRYRTVQQYLSLSLSAMTVALGAAVLENPETFNRSVLIRENRRALKEWVASLGGAVSMSPSQGGTTTCLTIDTSIDESTLFEELLRAGVLLIPGRGCFHYDAKRPWFRLGYGGDSNALSSGLTLLADAVRRVVPG